LDEYRKLFAVSLGSIKNTFVSYSLPSLKSRH
jgi:hypothetical protein